RAQHIGHHALAWQQKGAKEMPIAYVIGWEPTLDFCAGSPVPMGVCEYDVMGAIRGAPVELVKCESHDLYVPASACRGPPSASPRSRIATIRYCAAPWKARCRKAIPRTPFAVRSCARRLPG